jgi:hypothetical protein
MEYTCIQTKIDSAGESDGLLADDRQHASNAKLFRVDPMAVCFPVPSDILLQTPQRHVFMDS